MQYELMTLRCCWIVVALFATPLLPAQTLGPLSIPTMAKPFGQLPDPPPPDYALPNNWAARPDLVDAADAVPDNDSFGDRQSTAPVDVFYIHPTTYRATEYWNQPLSDAKTNDWTDRSVIARQAAVFNACCRVFAPRYRQATAASVYAPPAMNAAGAYDLAWQDVSAAFKYYLKHWNRGRPFIIAGHSQGALHTQRWLEEFAGDKRLRTQLVAAYIIGIGVPEGLSQRTLHGVTLCRGPRDTGCLLVWNTFARGGDGSALVNGTQQRFRDKYQTSEGLSVQCINPLTFDSAQPGAPAFANLGALPATQADGKLPATEAGRIGGACENGILYVEPLPQDGYSIVKLPAGMLHFNDFDLFYQNIRINAVARVQAYLDAHRR